MTVTVSYSSYPLQVGELHGGLQVEEGGGGAGGGQPGVGGGGLGEDAGAGLAAAVPRAVLEGGAGGGARARPQLARAEVRGPEVGGVPAQPEAAQLVPALVDDGGRAPRDLAHLRVLHRHGVQGPVRGGRELGLVPPAPAPSPGLASDLLGEDLLGEAALLPRLLQQVLGERGLEHGDCAAVTLLLGPSAVTCWSLFTVLCPLCTVYVSAMTTPVLTVCRAECNCRVAAGGGAGRAVMQCTPHRHHHQLQPPPAGKG